jgi:hypothetical protein
VTETLVGHRIDRRMGEDDALATAADGTRLRLVRIRDGDASGETAIAAWSSVAGDHLQRVVDLGTAPNGDLVAVLADVPYALPDLVGARALDASEAVTVLVPLAAAVAELQAAGVVHGAIGAAAVALTDAGSPVLLLPRTATRPGPDGVGMAADRHALAVLAGRLLPPPVPDALVAALEQDPGGAGIDRLFDLAEPRPVALHRAASPSATSGTPARLVATQPAAEQAGRGRVDLDTVRRSVRAGAARLGSAAAGVRRRVWVAAAAALIALAAAVVLLPGHDTSARARPETTRVPHVTVPPARPSPTSRASAARSASPSSPPSPAAPPTAGPTDPVRAATVLLAARARCLAGGTSACLGATDDPGSPVDALDRAALAAGVDAVLPPAVTPELLRSSGATAVLVVGPCTVLELHGPGGWRLRDVLAPSRAGAQMPSASVKSPSSSRWRTAVRNRAASAPSTMRWS